MFLQVCLYAQMPVRQNSLQVKADPTHRSKLMELRNKNQTKAFHNRWYNLGFTFNLVYQTYSDFYATPLFPDTLIDIHYSNGVAKPFIHVASVVLDPTHPYFGSIGSPGENLYLNEDISYTLDSLEVWFNYQRNHSDVTLADTLIVQYFTFDPSFTPNEWVGKEIEDAFGVDTLRVADLNFSQKTKSLFANPALTIQTSKVALSIKDTGESLKLINTNKFAVNAGLPVGASIYFKPSYAYKLNDQSTLLNTFWMEAWKEATETTGDIYPIQIKNDLNATYYGDYYTLYDFYNYSGWYQKMAPVYMMGPAFDRDHLALFFNLSASQSATVKETYKNVFSVWPNPCKGTCYFSTQKKEMAQIQLFSSDGKLIETYPINPTDNNINISDLLPGFYLLNYTSAKCSVTKQLIIN